MIRQTLKHALLVQLGIIYTRYLVGGAFVFASLIKIKGHRFTQMNGTVAGHNPAHFFEMMYQSGLYWQFIGVAQLLAGLLLLTQRFALLGALAFVAIMANIFVITISYDFAATPIITGLMLLAGLLLLAWDWNRPRVVLNQPVVPETTSPLFESRLWEGVGAVLSSTPPATGPSPIPTISCCGLACAWRWARRGWGWRGGGTASWQEGPF